MKWFFFVLALGTSFFCWTDDEIQWRPMKECGCVWQDQKLDKLWRSPRGGPFMMGVNPEYFVFCCRNRRKEAVCEVAAVWDRISKALCDNKERWEKIHLEGRRFSCLLEQVDCCRDARTLGHQMVMARINIGWEFRCIPVDGEPWCGCRWPNTEESASVEIQTENEDFAAKIDNLEEWEEEVTERLGEVYSECIQKHKHVLTLYEYGLLCQYTGEYQKSARLISEYIEATKKSLKKTSSPTPEDYLRLSTSYQYTRQYDEAIQALDEAIEKYPDNKDLYIQRLGLYFELGRYDEAVQDFLLHDIDKDPLLATVPENEVASRAFLLGALQAGKDGALELIPSFFSTIGGACQFAWATINHPIEVPSAILSEIRNALMLIRNREYRAILQAVAPEFYELCSEWDSLDEEERWRRMEYLCGKSVFDAIGMLGQKKLIDICIKIRKTNLLCNVKSLASPENKAAIISTAEKIAATRAEFFKKSKIQWDKQGKHIEGHNSRKTLTPDDLKSYSILTHKDPESLLKNYAGKGIPVQNKRKGELSEIGYWEDVDFGEVIGIWKSLDGEILKETTRGRIHYGKDATAHIVPIEPKGTP